MKGIFLALLLTTAFFILQASPATSERLPFKENSVVLRPLPQKEVLAYMKNPQLRPKLDFDPVGNNPQSESAGQSLNISGQIIGGTKAYLKQFPWQVLVIMDNTWMCGGSLISAKVVLTAAHCVYGVKSFEVTAGGIDQTTTEPTEKTQVSKNATYHELYDYYWVINDIGLIFLPQPFTLDTVINVIRLPKKSQATSTLVGFTVTVSGYGMDKNVGPPSEVLNYVSLTVITNGKCASYYGASTVISSTICTGAHETKSACGGDSGGPLMVREADGKFTQVGIVSFGWHSSCTRYPSGYARVTSFLGWISKKTGIQIRP